MTRTQRFVTLLTAFILAFATAMAQSSGDKLYNQGLQLQKTQTIDAQKKAIAKFNSAKKLYDSAAKKAQCDSAIAVSQNIIATLSKGGGGSGSSSKSRRNSDRTSSTQEQSAPEPTLSVSNNIFELDRFGRTVTVTVTTNQANWNAQPAAMADGKTFVSVSKADNKSFTITVPANNTYSTRSQQVMVSAAGLSQMITITQEGLPVNLTADKTLLKFKAKGSDNKVKISCNSDQAYEQNNGENWYVESKPDWIIVTINERRGKNIFTKIKDKSQDLITDITKGEKSDTPDMGVVETPVTLTAQFMGKDTPEGKAGRSGEVVLRSGDATLVINVTQAGY